MNSEVISRPVNTDEELERLVQILNLGDNEVLHEIIKILVRKNKINELINYFDYTKLPSGIEIVECYDTKKYKNVKEVLETMKLIYKTGLIDEQIINLNKCFRNYIFGKISGLIVKYFSVFNPNGRIITYRNDQLTFIDNESEDTNILVTDFRIDTKRSYHQFKIYHRIGPKQLDAPSSSSASIFAFPKVNNINEIFEGIYENTVGNSRLVEQLSKIENLFQKNIASLIRYSKMKDPVKTLLVNKGALRSKKEVKKELQKIRREFRRYDENT
jgi:hypothetical protein